MYIMSPQYIRINYGKRMGQNKDYTTSNKLKICPKFSIISGEILFSFLRGSVKK